MPHLVPVLSATLDDVARAMPALRGRVVSGITAQPELAADLLTHWRLVQPAAGRLYWAARSWSMLIWQPAYLSVFAVYCSRVAVPLSGLWQDVSQGSTAGFAIAATTLTDSEADAVKQPDGLIAAAAHYLLDYQQEHLPRLQAIEPYSTYQAACMSVDCLLSALQIVAARLNWNAETVLLQADVWLDALQLQRHGRLMRIETVSGSCTALDRKGCCQHFRIPGETACASCPRRPMSERLLLLSSE
ncbi:(2Fe-2S)-binding protein [Chitinibacter sp. S2-10]|uniref:(2Fe-2S)-binding protein n=1 Tax=Chitinibacter sp. S2-10 TaxID=3373597 RepID=UPI00397736AE